MRLAVEHARFIAEKIARNLAGSGLVSLVQGEEPVISVAEAKILEDIKQERAVDAEVARLMEEQDEEIDFYQADRKQLFWMIKRKVAAELDFSVDREERFGRLAHRILDELYEEDLVNYSVGENRITNLITKAIFDYGRRQDELEDRVHEKIQNYKRTVRRGTEEYDILFAKLYEEEIAKLGL